MDFDYYLDQRWQAGQYDCWAFVRDMYRRELGVELPVVAINAGDPRAVAHEFDTSNIYCLFERCEPEPFAVVGLSRPHAEEVRHVGVYLLTPDGPRIIHNDNGHGVCCQPLDALSPAWKIQNYYRYKR